LISRTAISLQHAGCSVTGLVRSNNEDAWLGDADLGLYVAADGMGGYQAGEVASALTVQTLHERVAAGDDLVAAINAAQSRLIQAADQGEGNPRMGTTVVAVQFSSSEFKLAWVGDSRAYLCRDGELQQLSRDHSYVQSLVDRQIITARQAEQHPQRNLLTQCLSGGQFEQPQVDIISGALADDDLLLLCSDGLSNEINDIEIAQLLQNHRSVSLATLVQAMVDTAISNGGRDNITVVLVRPEV